MSSSFMVRLAFARAIVDRDRAASARIARLEGVPDVPGRFLWPGSLCSENQLQCPASSKVRAGAAEVSENVGVVAARVFQRVGQDGETVGVQHDGGKGSILVGGTSERQHPGGSP